MAKILYQNECAIEEDDLGLTLLQMSLKHGVPHVHACGGNARCSTCRVMVHDGLDNVLPRNEAEQLLACKKGFEPNVRLACQTRVAGPVRIRRLVLDDTDLDIAAAEHSASSGREIRIAILFSDIRDFTPFSEQHLPYDVVHILNRYFHEIGEAVLQNGGFIDKYIGDGMMALFGLDGESPAETCLNAVSDGLQMLGSLRDLNEFLQRHFGIGHRHRRLGERGSPHRGSSQGDRRELADLAAGPRPHQGSS